MLYVATDASVYSLHPTRLDLQEPFSTLLTKLNQLAVPSEPHLTWLFGHGRQKVTRKMLACYAMFKCVCTSRCQNAKLAALTALPMYPVQGMKQDQTVSHSHCEHATGYKSTTGSVLQQCMEGDAWITHLHQQYSRRRQHIHSTLQRISR